MELCSSSEVGRTKRELSKLKGVGKKGIDEIY
jgi:endonuclease III